MNVKLITIIAILITITGVSFAYASLSTMMNISTSGAVRAANWDVHFQSLSNPEVEGEVAIITNPHIDGSTTAISNLDVKFNQINSSIKYYFDVVNAGDLPAQIATINVPTPVCTATPTYPAEVAQDQLDVCGAITYSLKNVATNASLNVGDVLEAGDEIRLVLEFSYAGTRLPINEVSISDLDISLIYVQQP